MDYKIKEIILNYFTKYDENTIQDTIAEYIDEPNGDEKIRTKLAAELDTVLFEALNDLPEHLNSENGDKQFISELLQYIYDTVDTEDLVTYLDWE